MWTAKMAFGFLIAGLLMGVGSPASVDAIAIRHDGEQAEYELAAEQFAAACRVTQLGSGVLIAPEWVLTAAHVGAVLSMLPAEQQVVLIGNQSIPIEAFHVPESREEVNPMDTEAPDDIALVKLARPVTGVEPMPMLSSPIDETTNCWIIGSGVLSAGDKGKEMGPSLMKDTTRALRAGTNVLEPNAKDPTRASIEFSAPASPMGTDLEAGTNVGDSGGPVVIMHDGDWYVAGIISQMETAMDGVIGIYEDRTLITLVDPYRVWIESAIE